MSAVGSEATPSAATRQPWLLRRWPAVVITAGTLMAGVVMFVVSARVNARHAWVASLLLNLGSAVVLFGPLVALTGLFSRDYARREQRRDLRVEQLSAEVGQVQRDVATVLEELSEQAVQRLAADRADEEAVVAAVAANPTAAGVAEALAMAERRGLVSARGPRVRVFDTFLLTRWQPSAAVAGAVEVTLERQDGHAVRTLSWTGDQTAADLGYELGRVLQELGVYPGDAAFSPGLMFRDLHDLLALAYRRETGAGSLVDPIGPIVQLAGERWAITDKWLTTTDGTHYRITLDRLTEMDWDAHLRHRDLDIGGFREAFDTATLLLAAGELTAPERERFP